MPTSKVVPSAVQNRDSTSAVLAITADGTDEPRTSSAEVTVRPCDRYPLGDRFPLGGRPTACAIRHDHRTGFGTDINGASGFAPKRPRSRKVLTHGEPTSAMPPAHVNRPAGLAGGTSTISGATHQITSTRLSKSLGK